MKETYIIDPNRCTACYACLRICPENAIHKATSDLCARCVKYCTSIPSNALQCSRNKMTIDPTLCTACGKCIGVCQEDAILAVKSAPAGETRNEDILDCFVPIAENELTPPTNPGV